ncbi:hypothetical protein EDC96DRAFT_545317 [Choanephora cucurbitarum]|nr:hypothetical protein EDC96DRAFT_545317 [Choanephora cucurbitarum]
MSCSEETEHGQRTMSRQEIYKRTETTLIGRRFINVNTTLTSSDNNYISEKQCSRNPLVILIDAGGFEMYKLLLNRVLLDSFDIKGMPISHWIIEAVIEIQRRNKRVLETINSFDYVTAGQHFWHPLESLLFFYDFSDYDREKIVQSDSVFQAIFAVEEANYHSSKIALSFHSIWTYKQHLLLKTKAISANSGGSLAGVDFYRRYGLLS